VVSFGIMNRPLRPRSALWTLPVLFCIAWAALPAPEAPDGATSADEPETRAAAPTEGALPSVPTVRYAGLVPPDRTAPATGGLSWPEAAACPSPAERRAAADTAGPRQPSLSFLHAGTRTRGPPSWTG